MERLTEQFARLPGIGGKTAQRLSFYILSLPAEEAQAFADAIVDAKKTVRLCPVCQNLTDQDLCDICADPQRDQSKICVVAEPKDVVAMERAREYHGEYGAMPGGGAFLDSCQGLLYRTDSGWHGTFPPDKKFFRILGYFSCGFRLS